MVDDSLPPLVNTVVPTEDLARLVGGPLAELETAGRRLSSLFGFFAGSDRLVVAPRRAELTAREAELALAYGLAWLGDRDLCLVLPAGRETPTLERAAFLEPVVRVWTTGGEGVAEVAVPRPADVLAGAVEPLRGKEAHDLGDRAEWIRPLLDWAESAVAVVPAHRSTYLAWHCAGRLVLRVRKTRTGLAVDAGVQYSKPQTGQPAPHRFRIKSTAAAAEVHRAVAAAARAAADRLEGLDAAHVEHRFQSVIDTNRRRFGWRDVRRELPARRAGGAPGFIDFLGIDGGGRLHVVETKLGSDEMLVLQGLDYWIWATANSGALAKELFARTSKTPAVLLDFVVAPRRPGGPALGPYSAAQAEALAGRVRWRLHEVTAWDGCDLTVANRPAREVPAAATRLVPRPRWAVRLQQHLTGQAGEAGVALGPGSTWPEPEAGLAPAALSAYHALGEQGLLHRYATHVRSSQAFALSLFAPLDADGRRHLVQSLLPAVTVAAVDPPVFEYTDPHDRLRERTAGSAHSTQVDVLLRATATNGAVHLVLIEVKLSETDFGHCSAYLAEGNDTVHLCGVPLPFGGDPAGCFQLRNHDRGARRRYDLHLGLLGDTPVGQGCWFREGANQPMRNVALARALLHAGEADSATVVLCAPAAHHAMWRRWAEARRVLDGVDSVTLAEVPADDVLRHHPDRDAAVALAERYLLALPED